jgi:probable rRNA maturation factor
MPHPQHNIDDSALMEDSSDKPPSAIPIDIRIDERVHQTVDQAWLMERLQRAATLLAGRDGVTVARVSVLIVGDERMIDLHQRHSNLASTTDVLTFDLRSEPSQPIDVDMVVCVDEAARQAADLGHDLDRELLLYCVHGLLHCAGHDDHEDAGWRRMHAREDEILAAIGVGPTFEPRSRAGRHDREPRA